MSDILVQPYSESEREALIDGIADLQEIERAITDTRRPGREVARQYVGQLLKEVRANLGEIFVAKSDGKTVGFIACSVRKNETVAETADSNTFGYIIDAYVVPEFRGTGVFKLLNRKAEEFLSKNSSVALIRITVLAGNERARRAYENEGYAAEEITMVKRVKRS